MYTKTFRRSRSTRRDEDNFVEAMEIENNTFLMILGIHAGQYPETIKAVKVKKVQGEKDDLIRDGDWIKIPSSMTVVVPAWEI